MSRLIIYLISVSIGTTVGYLCNPTPKSLATAILGANLGYYVVSLMLSRGND